MIAVKQDPAINQRVRAILLTGRDTILLIKRIKPSPDTSPYWVAPGGGVEPQDDDLLETLHRELCEELGATIEVISHAFMLEHMKSGKNLEEHFFVCYLVDYDLDLRSGPEFMDPARGEYIPVEVPLTGNAIRALNIKTPELQDWLLANLEYLCNLCRQV